MKTHGDQGWDSFPSYLDIVVPYVLEMLNQLGLSITVFVVGQDAALPENHASLKSIANAGHEIGNHSFHHEPWLHLYTFEQINDEMDRAENAIFEATGLKPIGFRGPGFSISPDVLNCLARRGYQYDASTLPTFLGPLARAYYFLTATLAEEERKKRKLLFGAFSEGFRPLKPYWYQLDSNRDSAHLLEIPVTTIPLFRTPFHLSYLLFLASFSSSLAWTYWRIANRLCNLANVGPSLLLHPLDFLGGDDVSGLDFFPGMRMHGRVKRAFVNEILTDYARRYTVLPLRLHADSVTQVNDVKTKKILVTTDVDTDNSVFDKAISVCTK
jgi:peptidoglycan/xylan/chitin deacetylase (PgdA/CDA1 family)